ncbi:MAG: hypothetical protein HKN01_00815 [Acidimicrobiia bacterium]|nr:hypothetical protein [Acidimicrobiia bacterium]
MRISRDEAREIAITALLLAIALRIGSGLVQGIDEVSRDWTTRSLLGRILAPIGSTIGIMTLGQALLAALSPAGSVSARLVGLSRAAAAVVAVLGVMAALNSLTAGFSNWTDRLWFAMANGMTAAVLGGAAWWILTNLDPER